MRREAQAVMTMGFGPHRPRQGVRREIAVMAAVIVASFLAIGFVLALRMP